MDVRDLSGRWALVTGAGSGIGQASALAFGQRGANLAKSVYRSFNPLLQNTEKDSVSSLRTGGLHFGPQPILRRRVGGKRRSD